MRKYAIVIEHGEHNMSAYVPDLPGCITTGQTTEEIKHNIREAIALHLEGMAEDGEAAPEPRTDGCFLRRSSDSVAASAGYNASRLNVGRKQQEAASPLGLRLSRRRLCRCHRART